MKNKMEVEGNIYQAGVYGIKTRDEKILYVGSSIEINDALSRHLYNLKRGNYMDNNKRPLQEAYDRGDLIFYIIHESALNGEINSMTIREKKAVQESLSVLEQFYINLYKDTVCNKHKRVTKCSSNHDKETTLKRKQANLGNNNPNSKYDKGIMEQVLWMKENDFKCKEISNIIREQYNIEIKSGYIWHIGIDKWVGLDSKYPTWISDYIATQEEDEIFQDMIGGIYNVQK